MKSGRNVKGHVVYRRTRMRNVNVLEKMELSMKILESMKSGGLNSYDHLRRMAEGRWPRKVNQ